VSLTATAFVLTWAAVVTLGFALAGVLARVHRLEERLALGATAPGPGPSGAGGPTVGTLAPATPGIDTSDGALLLFADRTCGSCLRVLPTVAAAGADARLTVHVLWSGAAGPTGDAADTGVVHHPDAGAVHAAYGVTAAPWLVAVAADGHIAASGPAGSVERTEALVAVLAHHDPEEVDR